MNAFLTRVSARIFLAELFLPDERAFARCRRSSSSLDHRLPRIFVSVRVKEKLVCSWISLSSFSFYVYIYSPLSLSLFIHSFAASAKKAPGKAGTRYYKNVGLGFKTPKRGHQKPTISTRSARSRASPSEVRSCPASSSLRK